MRRIQRAFKCWPRSSRGKRIPSKTRRDMRDFLIWLPSSSSSMSGYRHVVYEASTAAAPPFGLFVRGTLMLCIFLKLIIPRCFKHSDSIEQTNQRPGNKSSGLRYLSGTSDKSIQFQFRHLENPSQKYPISPLTFYHWVYMPRDPKF